MEDKKQQIIKNLKKSNKCAYPGCKNKELMNIMLPIGQMTESGKISFPNESKSQSVQSACPLCDYHLIFAEKGIINLVETKGLVQLFGPFPIVDIVEAVLEAKEFQKEIKKAQKKNAKNTIKTQKVSKVQ